MTRQSRGKSQIFRNFASREPDSFHLENLSRSFDHESLDLRHCPCDVSLYTTKSSIKKTLLVNCIFFKNIALHSLDKRIHISRKISYIMDIFLGKHALHFRIAFVVLSRLFISLSILVDNQ